MPTAPIILGEGGADEAFIRCLIKFRNLGGFEFREPKKPDPNIPDEEKEHWGKDGFRTRLKGLVQERGILQRSAVIIVADNDSNPANAFRNVQNEIALAGLQPPNAVQTKTQATEDFPSLAVLMIPNAVENGCLENLLLAAGADKYKVQLKCVEDFVGCTQATNWEVSDLAKLRMRCLLSAINKSNPCKSLTVALREKEGAKLFPWDHAVFQQIADYLKSFAAQDV